jgi:multidrug transporter EmrE-like cation transporter
MNHTDIRPIVLFLIAALLGALGQYFYKTSAESGNGGFLTWFSNYRFVTGVVCYIAIMFLFVWAFRIGGALTVLYPVYATTFIWSLIIGVVFLKEILTFFKIIGVGLIILGIILITR